MDEVEAAKIRMWAWKEMEGWTSGDGLLKFVKQLSTADELAAWVMSGEYAVLHAWE